MAITFSAIGDEETGKETSILWTILMLMLLGWAIGSLSGYAGSVVNLFLVGAIAVFVINLCSSGLRRAALR